MTTQDLRFFAVVASLLAGPAVATNPVGMMDLHEAKKKGDVEFLNSVCSGAIETRSDIRPVACSMAKTTKPKANLLESGCETIVQDFLDTGTSKQDVARHVAGKVAECGLYTELFEKVAQWGQNNDGATFLKELEAQGLPVAAQWDLYLKSHAGKAFFANQKDTHVEYGLKHIGAWLLTKPGKKACADLSTAALASSELARASLLPFAEKAGCREAAALVKSLLPSKSVNYRKRACRVLGEIGNASDAAAADSVARTG